MANQPYFEDSFSQPASPSKFRAADYQGNLVLVWPTEYRQGIKTDYGDSDAVAARVVVLDGANGVEEHDNVLFFQGALISTLKPSVGSNKPVLGRLGRGTSKPGQSAPFILVPFTEADAKLARDYFANQFGGTPAAPAEAPAAAGVAVATAGVPADKVDLVNSLSQSGVGVDQIALATGLTADQVKSIVTI
jgi:hypothetical protein